MRYEQTDNGLIELTFAFEEVFVVREAFREHIVHLKSIGNDDSVSSYSQGVAGWSHQQETYRCSEFSDFFDALNRFVDNTDSRVDELLDSCEPPDSHRKAGTRLKLGTKAAELVELVKEQRQKTTEGDQFA